MTNNLSQISSRITVSTWFLLFISESVDCSCSLLSVKPGHDYDALSQPGSCLIWAGIETAVAKQAVNQPASDIFTTKRTARSAFCFEEVTVPSQKSRSLLFVFLHPAEDEHKSSSSKHNSGKGCSPSSLPLVHFEFNQPIGMGHHMSQAPNLISHFPALKPCCWSGLDSSR